MSDDFDDTTRGSARDRELWARTRQEWRNSVESQVDRALDPNDLAAYLDGRLEGADLARVEAWMAGSDAALGLALSAREGLATAPLAVPDQVVRRAQAMVGFAPPQARGGWWRRLIGGLGFGELTPLAQAGAFAVVALIGFGSFQLGQEQGSRVAASPAAESSLEVADLSFTVSLDDIL